MSNIYVQEPPTSGKVVLVTSLGELEIELWSKECPKACRNFVQLCLEGYYDNTIFHNVVPNFIAQGGDPSGTGLGGESIYGEPFKNELHSRLRFVRRGLVATANSGKNDNVSQFFFTLAPTPELKNKHTIFGRMKFNDVDTDKEGRPTCPPRIVKTEVILNPFSDIEPRTSSVTAHQPYESKPSKSKGTKNLKLLSFAEDGIDEEETTIGSAIITKTKTSHDLVVDASSVTASGCEKTETTFLTNEGSNKTAVASSSEAARSSQQVTADEIEVVETPKDKLKSIKMEIKQVKRTLKHQEEEKTGGIPNDFSKYDADRNNEVLKQYHDEQLRYAEKKRTSIIKGDKREIDTLLRLESFRRKLQGASSASIGSPKSFEEQTVEEDESWLGHKLQFETESPTLAKDANTKDDKWFDIYDPRNALNKRRRQTLKQENAKHAKKE